MHLGTNYAKSTTVILVYQQWQARRRSSWRVQARACASPRTRHRLPVLFARKRLAIATQPQLPSFLVSPDLISAQSLQRRHDIKVIPDSLQRCSADSPAPSITTLHCTVVDLADVVTSRVGTYAVGISGAIRAFFGGRQGSPVCTCFSRPHASFTRETKFQ